MAENSGVAVWVGRDADGTLMMFVSEPEWAAIGGCWDGDPAKKLSAVQFPDIQPGELYKWDLRLVRRPTVFEPERGAI